MSDREVSWLLNGRKTSSLRGGFFSRGSNLTTTATSMSFKIASCLAMTDFLFCQSNSSQNALKITIQPIFKPH